MFYRLATKVGGNSRQLAILHANVVYVYVYIYIYFFPLFLFLLRCILWTLLTLSRASIVPTRLR